MRTISLITVLHFYCLTFSQENSSVPNLKKIIIVQSTFGNSNREYMDSITARRKIIKEYDAKGRQTKETEILDKDTLRWTTWEYNERNILFRTHSAKTEVTVYHDAVTDELITEYYINHEARTFFFDEKHNEIKDETKVYKTFKGVPVDIPLVYSIFTDYTYNEKDSLTFMGKTKDEGKRKFYDYKKKIEYGDFGRIKMYERTASSYNYDSTSVVYKYNEEGLRIKEIKNNYRDYMDVLKKTSEEISFFYDASGKLRRREKILKEDNEKEIEYISNGSVDSIAYYENGVLDYVSIKKDKTFQKTDTIPALAKTDGYNDYWKDGSKFTYDNEKRLIKLYFILDGAAQTFEYEYSGKLLSKKKYRKDENSPTESVTDYTYEFY